MNIDAQPAMLQDFAASVSRFSENIREECQELYEAMKGLANVLDPETVTEIGQMLQQICKILDSAEPDLALLHEKVQSFSRKVDRLQALLKY